MVRSAGIVMAARSTIGESLTRTEADRKSTCPGLSCFTYYDFCWSVPQVLMATSNMQSPKRRVARIVLERSSEQGPKKKSCYLLSHKQR